MVLLKVRVHLTTLLKVNQLLMVHLLLFQTLEDPKDKVRVKRYLTRVNKVKVKVSRVTLVNNLKEVNTDNKVNSRVKEGTVGTVGSFVLKTIMSIRADLVLSHLMPQLSLLPLDLLLNKVNTVNPLKVNNNNNTVLPLKEVNRELEEP